MAKYQLCEFWRTSRKVKDGLKSKNPWERGIARVTFFGGDVEFIIDEGGKKLPFKEVKSFRLLDCLGFAAIDTETNHINSFTNV